MNICKGCNQTGKTYLSKMDVSHRMFGREISCKDVPVIICDCGHIEYIYPRELDFQLRDAYRNGLKSFKFEQK